MRRLSRGAALISVLLIVLILFTCTAAFFFFAGRALKSTALGQESATAFYLADAGIEYAVFLLRHNLLIPRYTEGQERVDMLIQNLTFPVGHTFVPGVGVFRLSLEESSLSGTPYVTVRSTGQIFLNINDAENNTNVLDQRTAYARIKLSESGDWSSSASNKGFIIMNRWYEKWR